MNDAETATNATISETDPPWTSIGEHTTRFEPPDTLVFRAYGDITIADVDAFIEFARRLPQPANGFFYLSNLTHMQHQAQQAMSRFRSLPNNFIRKVCVVGAAFRHRVLLDMMIRTARFVGFKTTATMPHFAKTEEEAREYFAQLRNQTP